MMQTNVTPFYDASDNPTGCCPRFNPAGWENARLHFDKKPFLRATTRSIMHVPFNMGRVFARVQARLAETGAAPPETTLVLSRDLSPYTAEHLFAVARPVEGEEMTTLSGDFLTHLFEGSYARARGWCAELAAHARARGLRPGAVRFFYTTCPRCARVYGRNPVVGVVELA
jgi:hypothetical protein